MTTLKGFILALTITTFGFSMDSHSQAPDLEDNLFEAIQSIDYVSLTILLADGASIDTVDDKGNTPLMLTAKYGNLRMLNIVLSHNPDINRVNGEGTTALMIAARSGLLQVTRELIRHGAEIGLRNSNGETALDLASRYGQKEVANLLKEYRGEPTLTK